MSEEKNKLRIHAQITPEVEPHAAPTEPRTVRWHSIPHPLQRKKREPRPKEALTFSDRLLRNSALACALLLAILSMGNINQPWARSASESVRQALTMHIDLDETIGELSFVRSLMPESALVFLNLTGESELAAPVDGELSHPFTEAQPWLVFDCPAASDVIAAADGTVTAVSELSGDTIGVLIDHGSGLESVYAFLASAQVKPGDSIQRGQVIGSSEAALYFELRESEASIDPAERMGL